MIALLTDFGLQDIYVGVLKGVIQGIAPGIPVADITHAVPRGDVRRGAYMLRQAASYFPRGTVFLGVVDPGVGSHRRAIAIQTARGFFVGPDNGLFTYVTWADPSRVVVQLSNPKRQLSRTSNTFHGRDIFAPAAAHLASGLNILDLGPSVPDPVLLPNPRLEIGPGLIRGEVLHVDHFGNVTTSIGTLGWLGEDRARLDPWIPGLESKATVVPRSARARLGESESLPLHRTFADVRPGQLLAVINSDGHLEIAANQASAGVRLSAAPGMPVALEWG